MSALLLRRWPWLVIAALAILLAFGWSERRADKAALVAATARLDRFAADVRAATEKARADDQSNARRVETAQSTITKGASRDLETKLADARRLAADYARRLRAEADRTDPGRGGATDLSGPAGRAGPASRPGGAALLDEDVRICSDAIVKAQGWLDWWTAQGAVSRD